MPDNLIDGRTISKRVTSELAERVQGLGRRGVIPGLGVVIVGENPASQSYVRSKRRSAEEIGIFSAEAALAADSSLEDILSRVREYNERSDIHGILVQLPLPPTIDSEVVIDAVSPEKDADGLTAVNLGRLLQGRKAFYPCTPHGILQLLQRSGIETQGQEIVVIGRSSLVGKPLANLLSRKDPTGNATVTLCHSRTRDIASHCRRADIIVAAIGQPHYVTQDMVSEGAVVIDVGINRIQDSSKRRGYRLVGDVDFDAVSRKARAITPVPGGVGPMTVSMLLNNTVEAAERSLGPDTAVEERGNGL